MQWFKARNRVRTSHASCMDGRCPMHITLEATRRPSLPSSRYLRAGRLETSMRSVASLICIHVIYYLAIYMNVYLWCVWSEIKIGWTGATSSPWFFEITPSLKITPVFTSFHMTYSNTIKTMTAHFIPSYISNQTHPCTRHWAEKHGAGPAFMYGLLVADAWARRPLLFVS